MCLKSITAGWVQPVRVLKAQVGIITITTRWRRKWVLIRLPISIWASSIRRRRHLLHRHLDNLNKAMVTMRPVVVVEEDHRLFLQPPLHPHRSPSLRVHHQDLCLKKSTTIQVLQANHRDQVTEEEDYSVLHLRQSLRHRVPIRPVHAIITSKSNRNSAHPSRRIIIHNQPTVSIDHRSICSLLLRNRILHPLHRPLPAFPSSRSKTASSQSFDSP